MAQQELKLKVGADVGEAVNGVKILENQVARLKKIVSSPDLSFGQLERATKLLNSTQAQLNNFTRATGAANVAVAKTKTNFTGLSRVIQDLPFGFIGISNNLEQLLPAAGAAGLAISAIVSAVSFASIGLQNWSGLFPSANDHIKDHVKAIHDNQQALKDYVESLDDLKRVQIIGNQNAQEELVHLKTLYDATQNLNIPIAKRKELVDELQEQYPKYFANIKDEVILAGGATAAYNKLTTAIIATAKARAAQDALVDIQKELLALDKQHTEALQNESDAFQTLAMVQKSGKNDFAPGLVQSTYNKALAETSRIWKEITDRQQRAKNLAGEITNITQQNPDALLDPTGNLPKTGKDKTAKEVFHFHAAIDEPTHNEIHKIATEVGKNFSADFKTAVEESPEMKQFVLDVVGSISSVRNAGNKLGGEMGTSFGDVFQTKVGAAVASGMNVEQLEKFQEQLEITMVAGAELADVLGNAFGAFGNALVTGQNALQAFFGSVKSALGQLIGQLIKTVAIAAILSAITGGAGGGRLSFIGAFKSLLSVKPFAKGGLAFGPAIGLVGEGRNISKSNPEVISPLSDLKKFIGGGQQQTQPALFHRISGADLLLWMARANASGGRQG